MQNSSTLAAAEHQKPLSRWRSLTRFGSDRIPHGVGPVGCALQVGHCIKLCDVGVHCLHEQVEDHVAVFVAAGHLVVVRHRRYSRSRLAIVTVPLQRRTSSRAPPETMLPTRSCPGD